jgi:hypothetical protein
MVVTHLRKMACLHYLQLTSREREVMKKRLAEQLKRMALYEEYERTRDESLLEPKDDEGVLVRKTDMRALNSQPRFTLAVISSSSKSPSWLPCSACHGAGGHYEYTSWSFGQTWVLCLACWGGCGTWMPW